jgi:hypothetical protein
VLRILLGSLCLVVAAPLMTAAADGAGRTVIASCADGSVIFATKWEDVHCAGAARMPPGHVPRVASEPDRAVALAWEREKLRERDLDEEIAAAAVPEPRAPAPGSLPRR